MASKIKNSSKVNNFLDIPSERFYKKKEEVTLRFYQTPKSLYKNPTYKGLSLAPKQMYAILSDRLTLSIKNNWEDKDGNIYLIFSVEELSELLEVDRTAVMRYKKKLVEYELIFDKRVGQGKPNRIYVLKPVLADDKSLKSQIATSGSRKTQPQEVVNSDPINTNVNEPNLNNVKEGKKPPPVENSTNNNNEIKNQIEKQIELDIGKKILNKNKKRRSPEKESLAKEILNQMGDEHSLGFYRKVVDLVPETAIWRALSIVKDTFLQGNIKKSKGALFTTTVKEIALEQNIKL